MSEPIVGDYNNMQEILRRLLRNLGSSVAEYIANSFDVPEDNAKKVLPTVAPLIAFNLHEKTQKNLKEDWPRKFLTKFRDYQPDPELFFKDGGVGVSEATLNDIYGSSLTRIINNLANNLQIGYIQSQKILASVTAIVLTYFAKSLK